MAPIKGTNGSGLHSQRGRARWLRVQLRDQAVTGRISEGPLSSASLQLVNSDTGGVDSDPAPATEATQLYPIHRNIIARQHHSVTQAGRWASQSRSDSTSFLRRRAWLVQVLETDVSCRQTLFFSIFLNARPLLESRLKGPAGSGRATPSPPSRGCPWWPARSSRGQGCVGSSSLSFWLDASHPPERPGPTILRLPGPFGPHPPGTRCDS